MVAERRPIGIVALGALVVVAAAMLALAALRWSPDVPNGVASSPIAETVMTGEIAADVTEGTDINDVPRSPSGHDCLPRIDRSSGSMDVCWSAHRYAADSDPDKDYYLLVVSSTFGPGADGSPRWAAVRADLDGSPAGNVFSAWPEGEFDGPCEPTPVTLSLVDPGTEEVLCGHIESAEVGTWAHAVTWTCEGCLLPDDRERALSLYVAVGVPAGAVPVWQISADVGG